MHNRKTSELTQKLKEINRQKLAEIKDKPEERVVDKIGPKISTKPKNKLENSEALKEAFI